MLNKKQATDLAKAWRLGNKFRKKSLAKKHNIAPATSKNTGRVKMGIRMDIESKPQEYYPALDDDGALVFFSGRPMKRIPVSDLFTPPKAGKNRQRVPAKENTMINHKLKILETLFPNETDILESFLESHDLDINDYSIMTIKEQFRSFKIQLDERTEFQLVAQKGDGTELKSSWYKDENELSDMQQACEDSDDYESTSVMKRIVDVDEDEDNEEEFSSILPTDYTDGEEIEAGQNFSEDEVEEGKDVDYKELYKLTNLALKQIPGSPKQRETIKKLNLIRKKAGMKPLTEMEIDMNDEVNESVNEAIKFWTVTITKKAGKLFKGQTVDVKARNSAEAIKKGIKQMKGNPALVPSGSVDAVLGESTDIEENIGVKDGRRVVVKALTKQAALRLKKKLRNKFSSWDTSIDKSGLSMIVPNEKPIIRYIQKQPEVDTVGESTDIEEASEKQLLIKDLKALIKNPDARMVKMYGGNKYVTMLKKKLTKLESIGEATAAQLGKLSKQDILDLLKVFKGVTRAKKTVSMLNRELLLRKNESVELDEDASDDAKKLNLIHLGHGVYGKKAGEPSYKSDNDKLVKMSDDEIAQHKDGDKDLDGKPGVKEPEDDKKDAEDYGPATADFAGRVKAGGKFGPNFRNLLKAYMGKNHQAFADELSRMKDLDTGYISKDALEMITKGDPEFAKKLPGSDAKASDDEVGRAKLDDLMADMEDNNEEIFRLREEEFEAEEDDDYERASEISDEIDEIRVKNDDIEDEMKALAKKIGYDEDDLPMGESVEIKESKALDKLKFKGSDKKTAGNVVYMIKRGDTPKEIASIFKKLKTPSQEAIMTALGDRSSKDLLQKGKLLNSLISLFDEVDPKGLDGRSKAFREKLRKLEYNKKKRLPYEMFEKKVVKEKKLAGLQKKADKSGMPYGILKQVFNRGVAAWRTGHRPGTNPQQWGYARVNSFVTKSKGTWGGADKDLAAKVRK